MSYHTTGYFFQSLCFHYGTICRDYVVICLLLRTPLHGMYVAMAVQSG